MRAAYGLIKAVWLPVALGGLLLSATPAAAEPAGSYRELVRRALVAFDAKHWEEARALFQAAHQLEPNARTLRGLAMVAFEMEDFVAAYRLLRQSLLDPRRSLDGKLREQTQALLERTRLLVGRVRLTLSPPNATVKLDSEPIENNDDEILLNIGLHQLSVEAEGYETKKLSVDIRNGDDQDLTIQLEPVSLSAAVHSASDAEIASARVTASIDASSPASARDDRTVFQKWWFWAAAGGVVAVGVSAAILAGSGGANAEKPPVRGTNDPVISTLSQEAQFQAEESNNIRCFEWARKALV